MKKTARRNGLVLAGLFAVGAAALAAKTLTLDGEPHPAWRIVGRFHPVVVHFPVALLLLVPLLDMGLRWRPGWRDAIGPVLALGTAGAYVALAVGMALAYADGHSGAGVMRHLWGGVGVAVCATLALVFREANGRRGYVLAIWATVAVLGWTAHQGADLTHGEYYLTEGLPARLRHALRLAEPPQPEIYPADTVFGATVRPVLERNCMSCHGPQKQKGNYRMDTFALLNAGGESGRPAIMAKDATKSELLRRLLLPATDKKAMPPQGQPRPREADIKLLRWWIGQGASRVLTLAEAIQRDPKVATFLQAAMPVGTVEIYIPRVPDYTQATGEVARALHDRGANLRSVSKRAGDGLILQARNEEKSFDNIALARLSPLAPFVVEAELGGTRVDDAGVAQLKTFQNLTKLSLEKTKISGVTLDQLAALTHLETINLCDSALSDEGLKKIAALRSLRRLYTFGSAVTIDGLAAFRAARPDCETP